MPSWVPKAWVLTSIDPDHLHWAVPVAPGPWGPWGPRIIVDSQCMKHCCWMVSKFNDDYVSEWGMKIGEVWQAFLALQMVQTILWLPWSHWASLRRVFGPARRKKWPWVAWLHPIPLVTMRGSGTTRRSIRGLPTPSPAPAVPTQAYTFAWPTTAAWIPARRPPCSSPSTVSVWGGALTLEPPPTWQTPGTLWRGARSWWEVGLGDPIELQSKERS